MKSQVDETCNIAIGKSKENPMNDLQDAGVYEKLFVFWL
jgi:hypothetical protein